MKKTRGFNGPQTNLWVQPGATYKKFTEDKGIYLYKSLGQIQKYTKISNVFFQAEKEYSSGSSQKNNSILDDPVELI